MDLGISQRAVDEDAMAGIGDITELGHTLLFQGVVERALPANLDLLGRTHACACSRHSSVSLQSGHIGSLPGRESLVGCDGPDKHSPPA